MQGAAEWLHLTSGGFTGSSTWLGMFPVYPTLSPAPGFLGHCLHHCLPSRLSPVMAAKVAHDRGYFLNF